MATYKVLQDIEAEDKFLGPLTLKQCIFCAIAVVGGYLSVIFLQNGIWVAVLPLFPIIIITGFLGFPWGKDQPTEVWLLAKIKFMFKPRKRVWDQTGMQELVKITAPPPVQQFTGDNLSQDEVRSRLKALADTIDTRGWAIKGSTGTQASGVGDSDRLVEASTLPAVKNPDADAGVDIYDSALAQQIDSKITSSGTSHRSQVNEHIQEALVTDPKAQAAANNLWFMNQPATAGQAAFTAQTVGPATDIGLSPLFSAAGRDLDEDDQNVLSTINKKKTLTHEKFHNHKTLNPYDPNAQKPAARPMTTGADPATIRRARNNDRSIDSLAREAGDDEVVVSLH